MTTGIITLLLCPLVASSPLTLLLGSPSPTPTPPLRVVNLEQGAETRGLAPPPLRRLVVVAEPQLDPGRQAGRMGDIITVNLMGWMLFAKPPSFCSRGVPLCVAVRNGIPSPTHCYWMI